MSAERAPARASDGTTAAPASSDGRRGAHGRRGRWWIRIALTLLFPAAALALAEAGLRLAGYGYPSAFLVPAPHDAELLAPNPHFGRRFFPAEIARQPEALVLARPKPPGTFRVFVLGSSAAQGFPDPGTGIARILEVLLRERFPAVDFEVVNAAMVAINSHVVVDVARDCASPSGGDADALVVYEGNNEVIGPFGPGTVFAGFRASRGAIRATLQARRLRLVQLLDSLRRGGSDDALAEWTGMELFLDHRIPADHPDLARTAEHFRANLADVARAGTEHGKPVLLCTVGVNLRDCAPFASLHREGLAESELTAFDAAVAEGDAALAARDAAAALERFRAAATIDDRHADLRFRIARALEALGRADEARLEYRAARDLDALRFRTDDRLQQAIRDVAASDPGVTLVDVEHRMDSPDVSAHGIAGGELFLEHCHMTFAGNYLVARAAFEALVPRLPADVLASAPPSDGERPPASLERCAEELGLTEWHAAEVASSVFTLKSRPPFTFQVDHAATLAEAVRAWGERRAAATPERLRAWVPAFERRVAERPRDPWVRRRYGHALAAAGDLAGAEAQFLALTQLLPFDVDAGHALARARLLAGDAEGAMREYARTLGSPWCSRAHRAAALVGMAQVDERAGRIDLAAARYEALLVEQPSNDEALVALGQLELRRQRFAEAERRFRAALGAERRPGPALLGLARALAAQDRVEEAATELEAAGESFPDDPGLWLALGDALSATGRTERALTAYENAARLAPAAAEARLKLGAAYLAAGRHDEAVRELAEAARLRPELPGVQELLRQARTPR